jgi:hypothetical protein
MLADVSNFQDCALKTVESQLFKISLFELARMKVKQQVVLVNIFHIFIILDYLTS